VRSIRHPSKGANSFVVRGGGEKQAVIPQRKGEEIKRNLTTLHLVGVGKDIPITPGANEEFPTWPAVRGATDTRPKGGDLEPNQKQQRGKKKRRFQGRGKSMQSVDRLEKRRQKAGIQRAASREDLQPLNPEHRWKQGDFDIGRGGKGG